MCVEADRRLWVVEGIPLDEFLSNPRRVFPRLSKQGCLDHGDKSEDARGLLLGPSSMLSSKVERLLPVARHYETTFVVGEIDCMTDGFTWRDLLVDARCALTTGHF